MVSAGISFPCGEDEASPWALIVVIIIQKAKKSRISLCMDDEFDTTILCFLLVQYGWIHAHTGKSSVMIEILHGDHPGVV